jgi:hypothetical protein
MDNIRDRYKEKKGNTLKKRSSMRQKLQVKKLCRLKLDRKRLKLSMRSKLNLWLTTKLSKCNKGKPKSKEP